MERSDMDLIKAKSPDDECDEFFGDEKLSDSPESRAYLYVEYRVP